MSITSYGQLKSLFVAPEKTQAKIPFGNPPNMPVFEQAKLVTFGVPFDDTATSGRGAEHGPAALRHVSARQIETYVADEKVDVYEKVPVFDLGDFRINNRLGEKERLLLLSETADDRERVRALAKLQIIMRQFDVLKEITVFLRRQGKIPLMLGGEHTLSYWPLSAVADEEPIVLHFDAHRDAKSEYMGMKFCHVTPIFHFLKEHRGKAELVQIGIRQTSREEEDFAGKAGIVTFCPNDVKERPGKVKNWLNAKTKKRNVYITFDIDALDIAYTPCTGTPEPFGLTPEEVVAILKSVNSSARLVGMDMMEVSAREGDFREAAVAVQLLLRIFARAYVR